MNRFPALLLALLLAAACKGESHSPVHPALPPPGNTAAAEARIEASSGPVRIVLEIHQTKVRLSDWKGAVYFRATVFNLGKDVLALPPEPFEDPFVLSKQRPMSIYLLARGSNGKPVDGLIRIHGHDPSNPFGAELTREQLDRLKHLVTHPEERPALPLGGSSVTVEPGKSASTPTWVFDDRGPIKRVEGFAQVPFDISKPGNYSLSLVYDRAPTPEIRRMLAQLRIPTDDSHIRLQTAPVHIEVLP